MASRIEEYNLLIQELDEPVPALEGTFTRAQKKYIRRKRILRPLIGGAAFFAVFVLMVNFCTPVAYACSKIPFLKELAEAVTFSRSLSDAVDNQYVQPLYLKQTDGSVTASVEYLIVDQKQVNIFYRLDSDIYEHMEENPLILMADGTHPSSCSYSVNEWDVPNGELRSVTVDFLDTDVPSCLRFQMDIENHETDTAEAPAADVSADEVMFAESADYEPDCIARFDFLLEFDPDFTAVGKVVGVNKTVELDGQSVTLTDMEIYPTHLRLNVAGAPENTAWLTRLDFYIETDWGMKFDVISNGITATGSPDSPMMISYRADSSYFYEAKHLKAVITGAEWLDKDMETVSLNLETGECGPLPDGVTIDEIKEQKNGWLLRFRVRQRKPDFSHQIFSSIYYDIYENERYFDSWNVTLADEDGYFTVSIPLRDYPYDEVLLCPSYSHEWQPEKPVAITVQ